MDLFMKQAPQRHLTPRRLHLGVPGLPRTADGIPGLGRGTALGGGGGSQETLSPRGKGLPRAGAGGHPTQAASEAAGECKGGQAARRRRRGEVRRAGRIPRRHSPEGHLWTHVLVPRGSRRSSASFPLCSGCSGSNTSCEHQPLLPSMRSSSCSLPARGPSAPRGSVSAAHRTARRLYGECRHLAPKSTIKAPAPIWLQGALGGGATMQCRVWRLSRTSLAMRHSRESPRPQAATVSTQPSPSRGHPPSVRLCPLPSC